MFLYVCYKILIENTLTPRSLNTPANGIEFKNPNTREDIGIYHVHLDGYVLIWYFRISNHNHFITFEYIQHPSDDYKDIITDIYNRDDGGYNISSYSYFIDTPKLIKHFIMEYYSFMRYMKQTKAITG